MQYVLSCPNDSMKQRLTNTLCTTADDSKLRDVMISVVTEAKERSALSAETLTAWRTEGPTSDVGSNLRGQCELLMGPVDQGFAARCDQVIRKCSNPTSRAYLALTNSFPSAEHFEAASKIKGPIGHEDGLYLKSPEWLALAAAPNHHLNFVSVRGPPIL